jgi:hypothetical protein
VGVQFALLAAFGQKAALTPASSVTMPAVADCNSPASWQDDQIRVFNSAGAPMRATGQDQFHLGPAQAVSVDTREHFPMWIESNWQDSDGTLYEWYHNEPAVCGGKLTAPRIGALVSHDGGQTFQDLGIVLESGDPVDCSAANGFFAGGHGDFSVILDQKSEFFYFLFGNYGGDLGGQGVAVARMDFNDRQNPAGKVRKYYAGGWTEPGLGGHVTPVFPAVVGWQFPKTDSFWGPSVHWNTYLERYVVLMNRSCCRPMWPQEGIYVSFNLDLADPGGWSRPERIMAKPPDYYPQVLGLEAGGTDTVAGEVARFYIHGRSSWEIVFFWPAPEATDRPAIAAAEPKAPTSAAPPVYLEASPARYLLTVSVAPAGSGFVSATPPAREGYYTQDSSVELTARAAPGYRFSRWSGGIDGESNRQSAVLSAPLTATANFVPLPPELAVAMSHAGDFSQGQQDAAYSITVTNGENAGITDGDVMLKAALPSGMSLVSMSGSGWSCSGASCSRSDPLAGGARYAAITLAVRLAPNAGSSLTNEVTVSGGGSAPAKASDTARVLKATEAPAPAGP